MRPTNYIAVFAAALSLSACKGGASTPSAPPPPVKEGTPVALPADGIHHTERLAWSAWLPSGAFIACGRTTDDFSKQGRLGKCLTAAPGPAPAPATWPAGAARDASPVDAAPAGCKVLLDDIPGDPGAPPARATLVGPTGKTPLAEWKPPREVDGDYFALETSFSPDGKTLALARTSVGRGEGDQRVDVVSVELRPAPPCH